MTWNNYKQELYDSIEDDFYFANILIGDIRYYLGKEASFEKVKNTTLKLLKEWMSDDLIHIYLNNNKQNINLDYKNETDIEKIISEISNQLEEIDEDEVEPNLFWITTKANGYYEIHWY